MKIKSGQFRRIIKMAADLLEDGKELDAAKALSYFQDKDMDKLRDLSAYSPMDKEVDDYVFKDRTLRSKA